MILRVFVVASGRSGAIISFSADFVRYTASRARRGWWLVYFVRKYSLVATDGFSVIPQPGVASLMISERRMKASSQTYELLGRVREL